MISQFKMQLCAKSTYAKNELNFRCARSYLSNQYVEFNTFKRPFPACSEGCQTV